VSAVVVAIGVAVWSSTRNAKPNVRFTTPRTPPATMPGDYAEVRRWWAYRHDSRWPRYERVLRAWIYGGYEGPRPTPPYDPQDADDDQDEYMADMLQAAIERES
jgi:hypothetical protein